MLEIIGEVFLGKNLGRKMGEKIMNIFIINKLLIVGVRLMV